VFDDGRGLDLTLDVAERGVDGLTGQFDFADENVGAASIELDAFAGQTLDGGDHRLGQLARGLVILGADTAGLFVADGTESQRGEFGDDVEPARRTPGTTQGNLLVD